MGSCGCLIHSCSDSLCLFLIISINQNGQRCGRKKKRSFILQTSKSVAIFFLFSGWFAPLLFPLSSRSYSWIIEWLSAAWMLRCPRKKGEQLQQMEGARGGWRKSVREHESKKQSVELHTQWHLHKNFNILSDCGRLFLWLFQENRAKLRLWDSLCVLL